MSRDDGYFNVADFGPVGTQNDTATIAAAVAAAKATITKWGSKGLFFPPGTNYTVTSPIDFRGISNVRCDGWLLWSGPEANGPSFRFGQPNSAGSGRYIFHGIYDLSNGYAKRRHPLVQFSGLRGGHVELGVTNNFVEVFAEPGPYVSTAWSRFFLGQTWRLELRGTPGKGNGTGWINSNQFYGGALAQLRIGGPWVDVTSVAVNGSMTRVTTATQHNFVTGNLVEMYNGSPVAGRYGLVTVVNATQFNISGSYTGGSWRCMSRSGYSHNENTFYNPDIEDSPALVFIHGSCNHLLGCRMEAKGQLVFGPDVFGNTIEVSNTTHGRMPDPGEGIDMEVVDYGGGKNFAGWFRVPKAWGL